MILYHLHKYFKNAKYILNRFDSVQYKKKKSKQRFLKRDDIWGGIIVRIELREYLLVIYNNVPLKLFANAQQP